MYLPKIILKHSLNLQFVEDKPSENLPKDITKLTAKIIHLEKVPKSKATQF